MLPTTLPANAYLPSRAKAELDFKASIKRGDRKMPAKRVQEHLTLRGFGLDIDSDFGPTTEKRVKDFQASKQLPVTGIVDFATWEKLVDPLVLALQPIAAGGKTLSQLTLDYARQHVRSHPREAGGDNRGPWVRCYLGWDGADARWCAGFVCFALEQAADTLGVGLPIGASASCDVLAKGAQAAHLFVAESRVKSGAFAKSAILPGSFFLKREVPNDWTHVGIVLATGADAFDTVEGNTDNDGSSNGFEAAERARGYGSKDFIVW
jgi:hypothetical protein